MEFKDTDAIMPKRKSVIRASLVVALTLATSAAYAGRQVHGGDVARMLSGRAFNIECIDGTVGRGKVTAHGMASVSYRRPDAPSGPEQFDNAVVRVKGAEICLAWRQFGGGGDGCYPVSEEAQGRYRLSTGPLWCDISPK